MLRATGPQKMLEDIERECFYTAHFIGGPSLATEVMEAMAAVPRDAFVPPEMQRHAWDNSPLPIGDGQTISQPFIVALMTDLLQPAKDQVILEVGTGSGYQSAVLARLVRQVYSVEIIPALAEAARERLDRLGYHNVQVISGDGYQGWAAQAPYDGIIVTAAASHVPPPLKAQLKVGGRLVLPVGLPAMHQELLVIERGEKDFHTRSVLGVAFVPLTGSQSAEPPPTHEPGRS